MKKRLAAINAASQELTELYNIGEITLAERMEGEPTQFKVAFYGMWLFVGLAMVICA